MITSCACTTLRKASRAITRLYDERLAGHGMTITQFALLRNIARDEGIALSRLAELLVMERTSLYRALALLERQGWVAVAAGPGRAKQVSLTAEGRAAMAGAEGAWERAQQDIVGRMGQDEWERFEAQVHQLAGMAQVEMAA